MLKFGWHSLCFFVLSLGVLITFTGETTHAQTAPSLSAEEVAFLAGGLRPDFIDDLQDYAAAPYYRYDLTLDPDFDQTVIYGTGAIRFYNNSPDPLNEIVLRLYPNLQTFGGDAGLSNVRLNGFPIEPSLDETRSVIGLPLPIPMPLGERLNIEFDYELRVQHGLNRLYNQFSYLETELALASALPILSVYETGYGWWREVQHAQGDAVYSETGHWDVRLTAPSYLKVIASGSLVEQISRTEGNLIWLTHRFAAPLMRDFAIMSSRRYEVISGAFEDIELNVYYLPNSDQDRLAAQRALRWVEDAMAAFTDAFGAYVYAELDIVQTYTSAGGIEYPGLIVVSDNVWNPNSALIFEWVTVHEVAHQWWYSMVGNDQVRFPWLDEALTDWSVGVYAEYIGGGTAYEEFMARFSTEYTAFENEQGIIPIGNPAPDYSRAAYSPIVYRKGGYFFHLLRLTLGDAAYFSALQNYLADFRYEVATPSDLQAAFEAAHGASLAILFLQFVGYAD